MRSYPAQPVSGTECSDAHRFLSAIDAQITQLKEKSAVLYDCPELKQHRVSARSATISTMLNRRACLQYDLRAVLVHDGLFGRMHLYSYVEQDGVWWKTVDHMVDQARVFFLFFSVSPLYDIEPTLFGER